MSAQVQISNVQPMGNQFRVAFNVILTGNYPTGGDTLNFATATQDPNFVGMVPMVDASQGPISLDVWDMGGNITNGVFPVLGANPTNSKLKFTSAFNTELGAGAYPASITSSKIAGEAIFNKML